MTEIMTDQEFVRAFESCELSPDLFHHRDHIRLARIYVELDGAAKATERFRSALRKFAAHIGKSEKYHETITVAWMRLVVRYCAAPRTRRISGQLMDKKSNTTFEEFYSPELLATDAARTGFVEPDREGLPGSRLPTPTDELVGPIIAERRLSVSISETDAHEIIVRMAAPVSGESRAPIGNLSRSRLPQGSSMQGAPPAYWSGHFLNAKTIGVTLWYMAKDCGYTRTY